MHEERRRQANGEQDEVRQQLVHDVSPTLPANEASRQSHSWEKCNIRRASERAIALSLLSARTVLAGVVFVHPLECSAYPHSDMSRGEYHPGDIDAVLEELVSIVRSFLCHFTLRIDRLVNTYCNPKVTGKRSQREDRKSNLNGEECH